MNWSENNIWEILQESGDDWKFFKNYDKDGNEIAQYKFMMPHLNFHIQILRNIMPNKK